MKNVHLITTEKESNLYRNLLTNNMFVLSTKLLMNVSESNRENKFIYITNDEIIREGNYYLMCWSKDNILNKPIKADKNVKLQSSCLKIVLTNNPDLITEGVQEISEEFLKQFVTSPVDYVEVEEFNGYLEQLYDGADTKITLKNGDVEKLLWIG